MRPTPVEPHFLFILKVAMKTLRHSAIRELVAHSQVASQDELRRRYGLTVENTVAKVKAQFTEAPTLSKLIEMA